jgi:hypothetical protein
VPRKWAAIINAIVKKSMLALWDSLDGLSNLKEWIAGALVLLAVIGFFVDRRASKLQAVEDKKSDQSIANAVARAEEAKAEQEKLRKEALELDRQVLALRLRLQDRRVAPDQRTNLVNCLRQGAIGPVIVGRESFGPGSAEATQFAKDILAVLVEVRFLAAQGEEFNIVTHEEPGVFVYVKDPSNPPPHALSIQACFKASAILPMNILRFDFKSTNVVGVFISGKP